MMIVVDSKERRDFARNLVANIRREQCPMKVTIEPYIEGHSKEQQALWHVLIKQMADHFGYEPEEMKQIVKVLILGTEVKNFRGKDIEVIPSSQYDENGKITDKQYYSNLIEHTYRIAAEEGLVLE